MKKKLLVAILVFIIFLIIGICIYVINTPEYALKEIIDDVNTSGIDGLYPHLTGDAKKTIDTVSTITDNNSINAIVGFVSKSEYVGTLKSKIQEIHWNISKVLKDGKNASVIMAFNYDDKLIGTIELLMVRVNGKWKIEGLEFPKFEKIIV